LIAWSRALRALHAVTAGQLDEARGHLDVAHRFLDPAYPLDYALFHFVSARLALRRGDPQSAAAHVTMCLQKNDDGGSPVGDLAPILSLSGAVHAALGRFDEAVAHFARAAELSSGVQEALPLCHLHLTRGVQLFRAGAPAEARTELGAGFAQARSIDYVNYFGVLPDFAAEVCGAALELDVDAAYVRKTIATRSLTCPDRGIAAWPWPLSVRALGGFAIERDGVPFKFARKAPKRLLDVLRLVVAFGGLQVDAGRVASALWPDADGDEGRSALKAMLHRARLLLGVDPLVVREGQISFDAQMVWLDTWAFEHVSGRIESLLLAGPGTERTDDGELERRRLQLFALYRGNLFGVADVPAWALQARDRLRARFVRAVDLLGQRLERRGHPDEAIALYRAALEQDNLAEELYQRLMECHLSRGEHAQALNAYRRCRELLSIVLGLKPSARTEALAARIAAR
jgi:DNA-binding SARP family transcriptional activator/Flp pilus assembly protein TadD